MNVGMTLEGGYCVVMSNNNGATIPKGYVVKTDPNNDDAVVLVGVGETLQFGVAYEDIPSGSQGLVVFGGIADVVLSASATASRGNWLGVSTASGSAGRVDVSSSPPTTLANRMRQVGFAMRNQATPGGLVRARIIIL